MHLVTTTTKTQNRIETLKQEIAEYRSRGLEHTEECADRVSALAALYETAAARQKSGLTIAAFAALALLSAGVGSAITARHYAPYVAELDEIMAVSPVTMLQRIAPELDAEELLRAGISQLAEAGADEDDIASAIDDAREGVQP